MRRIIIALLLVVIGPSAVASTIYKCKDAAGKTVFSDRECPEAAEIIEYKHPETWRERHQRESDERRAEHAQRMREIEESSRERRKAIAEIRAKHDEICRGRLKQDGLVLGMKVEDIRSHRLWGYPDRDSKSTMPGAVVEHWAYECEGFSNVRLVITNGRLSSIHQ